MWCACWGCCGPRLTAEAAFIHPATLASTMAIQWQAEVVTGQEASLQATLPALAGEFSGTVLITADMAIALHPVIPSLSAEYDINVFRGPSRQVADDWQLATGGPADRCGGRGLGSGGEPAGDPDG